MIQVIQIETQRLSRLLSAEDYDDVRFMCDYIMADNIPYPQWHLRWQACVQADTTGEILATAQKLADAKSQMRRLLANEVSAGKSRA
jgi:hypothetical protein